MEKLLYDIGEVLGVTILHSLWQGLIIYCLVRLALTVFPAASSANKYQLLYVSMVALTVWFGITFFNQAKNYQWSAPQVTNYAPAGYQPILTQAPPAPAQSVSPTFHDSATKVIKTGVPYLSAIYLVILLVNVVRFAVSWKKVGSVKNSVEADDNWQEKVNRFAEQLAVAKYVQLGLSQSVDGPCTVGYLKPVILLPIAFTTQLSTQEVEAILLHELAHIKNNDYLYNIIQQMMVVVLFLNPFAQFISRMVSSERENRCDDVVVALTENPMPYARALVKLEEIRYSNMQLALAATGQKYQLLARIERLIKREKPIINIKHLLAILLLFVFSVGSLAWLNPEIKNGKLVSVRGAKAVTKLAAIVKSVVTKNEEPVVAKVVKSNIVAAAPVSSKTVVIQASSDTILTAQQREALSIEYRKVAKEVNEDFQIIKDLPINQQLSVIRKTYDSLRSAKYKEAMTPELLKQRDDVREALKKYFNSPEYLKMSQARDAAYKRYHDLLYSQPEMAAFDKDNTRQRDSIYAKLTRETGLTEDGLRTNWELNAWAREQNIKRQALEVKLLGIPEIKAANDSSDAARKVLADNPGFDKVNQITKASPKMQALLNFPEFDKYEADIKNLQAKLNATPQWKKFLEDLKKQHETLDKLYGRKPRQ